MEFKNVKIKLNLLYTGSLLIILILFIAVLYFFISKAINEQEIDELERFFYEEKHEFIEELYENNYEHAELKYDAAEKHKKRLMEEYDEVNGWEKEDDDDDEGKYKRKDLEHVKYRPERYIFYYIFDKDFNLIEGEESVDDFVKYIESSDLQSQQSKMIKEVEWDESHVLFTYYPIQENGQIVGSVIVGKDITDEKHLIQKIIQILLILTVLFSLLFAGAGNFFAGQAMKPILRAYEKQRKFVSDASHELRTPLSVFYSSIDVLSREEEEHLSPIGKQVLEDVKHESEMMHKLLDDLLFLARSDQDNFELDLEELDLSSLLHELLNRFKRVVPSHLTLVENIQEGVFMRGDKVRIQQLVYILLDNAIRYTEEGSITCSLSSQGEKIVISIKDTGIGIPSEKIDHIFDRFYRGDASRKRTGTGLGLAIAKTIVEAHQGKIEVKSEVGKGTEFLIKFTKNN